MGYRWLQYISYNNIINVIVICNTMVIDGYGRCVEIRTLCIYVLYNYIYNT